MTEAQNVLLITFSGADGPGVTSRTTSVLAKHGANVLDIGQAAIHDTLTLGILVEIPGEYELGPVRRELLNCASDMNMQVRFEPISAARYEQWVAQQGKARHIVTLLARKLTARQIADVTDVAVRHHLNIDSISRLSGRVPLDNLEDRRSRACVEFSARGQPADLSRLRADFMELSSRLDIDIAIQADNIYRRNRRLVCFDMDSTLVEAEVIDELAEAADIKDQVAAITARAMAGELDFDESFRQRMALLQGVDAHVLADIAKRLPVTEGAEKLIATLRQLGYKTAILSGGFGYFAEHLAERLGMDYVYANHLEIVDGKVSGRVVGEIINGDKKAQLLKELAEREGISLEQVIAVGDGANDLPMLSAAGLGIAYRAKPLVKASAEHSISTLGLDAILYLLGLRDRDRFSLESPVASRQSPDN